VSLTRNVRTTLPILGALTSVCCLLGSVYAAQASADAQWPCRIDDALSEAAGELLLRGGPPSPTVLDEGVRRAGSDAVFVRALFLADEDDPAALSWLREQRAHADSGLLCGQARGSAGRLLIVAASGGTLEVSHGARARIRGTLAPGFDHAELIIQDRGGELSRYGVDRTQLATGIELDSELVRPLKVQLLARGPRGPRPVAERLIVDEHARAEQFAMPNLQVAVSRSPAESDEAALTHLALRLDELRRDRGVMSARKNRLLIEVARKHAAQVCDEGRLAHELAAGQDPQARLLAAGIESRLVGETIARAADVSSAFSDLGESPSHLLTLLERRFTDVGFGAAHDAEGKACLVVLLAAFPRYRGR
jgi:hypothetical protein